MKKLYTTIAAFACILIFQSAFAQDSVDIAITNIQLPTNPNVNGRFIISFDIVNRGDDITSDMLDIVRGSIYDDITNTLLLDISLEIDELENEVFESGDAIPYADIIYTTLTGARTLCVALENDIDSISSNDTLCKSGLTIYAADLAVINFSVPAEGSSISAPSSDFTFEIQNNSSGDFLVYNSIPNVINGIPIASLSENSTTTNITMSSNTQLFSFIPANSSTGPLTIQGFPVTAGNNTYCATALSSQYGLTDANPSNDQVCNSVTVFGVGIDNPIPFIENIALIGDMLNIEYSNPYYSNLNLIVTNLLGQEVYKSNLDNNYTNHQVEITQNFGSMIIVNIVADSKLLTSKKFLLQN